MTIISARSSLAYLLLSLAVAGRGATEHDRGHGGRAVTFLCPLPLSRCTSASASYISILPLSSLGLFGQTSIKRRLALGGRRVTQRP